MKVYVATSGDYSDYRIMHVFARREDAEAYEGADRVEEYELREGPVEMRTWYTLIWNPGQPDRDQAEGVRGPNPWMFGSREDFDGDLRRAGHQWDGPPGRTGPVLTVKGWERERVLKVYSEQRAQHLAQARRQPPPPAAARIPPRHE